MTVLSSVNSVASFIQEASIAHYNVIGQYTFPRAEKKESEGKDKTVRDVGNPAAQVALFIIPVIPVVYLLAVTLIPLIGNSCQSIPIGFGFILNSALFIAYPEVPFQNPGDKRGVLEHVYGLPGLALGALCGLIPAALCVLYSILRQTIITTWHTGLTVVEFLTGATDLAKGAQRRCWQKYGLGLLGLPLGLILGIVPAALYFLGRVLLHTVKVQFETARDIMKLVLAEQDAEDYGFNEEEEKKKGCGRADYMLGCLGIAPGIVFGTIGAMVILLGRLITNNVKSAYFAFKYFEYMIKLAEENDSSNQLLDDDKKRGLVLRLIGGIGFLFGCALKAVFLPIQILLEKSWLAFRFVFKVVYDPSINLIEHGNLDRYDDAPSMESVLLYIPKLILGLPGTLLGFGSAVIGVALCLIIQFFCETARSYSELVEWIHDLIHVEEHRAVGEPEAAEQDHKKRSIMRQLIGGLLGYPLALICGVVDVLIQILVNTLLSFLYLSGALINVGRGSRVFDTLNKDDRATKQKAFGMIGYALAIAISGPLALIILAARILKKIAWIGLCVLLSPFVTFFNLVSVCCSDRADSNGLQMQKGPGDDQSADSYAEEDASDDKEDLERLYRSLNAWGELSRAKQRDIFKDAGYADTWRFAVKCLTLNSSSLHEEVLEIFRISGGQEDMDEKIEKLKEKHTHWWMTSEEKERVRTDVDLAKVFIEKCLDVKDERKYSDVPAVSSRIARNFWGDDQHDGSHPVDGGGSLFAAQSS